MRREELIDRLRGDDGDAIDRIAADSHDRVLAELEVEGLPVRERWSFFLTRVGTDFSAYAFDWEPFRDFAGSLLPGRDSVPVVVYSEEKDARHPRVEQVTGLCPCYEIRVSRNQAVGDIASSWLEVLAENEAIPMAGGVDEYKWFFERLDITPKRLSPKALGFVNMFAES